MRVKNRSRRASYRRLVGDRSSIRNLKIRFEFQCGQWKQMQGDRIINRARLRQVIDRRDRSIDRLKQELPRVRGLGMRS
jgi:hypothetical protein